MDPLGNALVTEPWQPLRDKLSKLAFTALYWLAESVLIEVNVYLNTEEKISLCILNLHRLKPILRDQIYLTKLNCNFEVQGKSLAFFGDF